MPLTVVTVNVNDSADTVREKAGALTVPILLGAGKEVVKSYDAEQLPGPGQYEHKSMPLPQGGRVSKSNARSEFE